MEVSIVSKKLIKPSHPTPLHLRNMSISLMDYRHPPRAVPFILYYTGVHGDNNHHPDSVQAHVEILKKRLEKSLSEILTLYYPLAGRYVKENLMINCNDEGAEYAEALVNGELGQILGGQFEIKDLNHFVPDDQHLVEESAKSPLLAVQINSFKCGGLAIGLRISHRICDGFTLSLFQNGWAKACKTGNLNDVTVPNFEAGILFPPPRDSAMAKFPSLSGTTSEIVTRRLVFDAKTMSKSAAMNKQHRISTLVVIALIWRAQIKAARRAREGFLRTSLLSVAINLRGKTFRKTSENSSGNIFTVGTARFEGDDEETKMGLNEFVDKVREAIRSCIAEFGTAKEDEEEGFFSKLIMRPVMELAEQIGKGEEDHVHRFTSVRKFPFYEVDFGWGKPAWVSIAERQYKGVMFLPTKGGDGVEVWVTMDKEEIDYFQNDPDILPMLRIKNGDGIHPSFFPIFRSKI